MGTKNEQNIKGSDPRMKFPRKRAPPRSIDNERRRKEVRSDFLLVRAIAFPHSLSIAGHSTGVRPYVHVQLGINKTHVEGVHASEESSLV